MQKRLAKSGAQLSFDSLGLRGVRGLALTLTKVGGILWRACMPLHARAPSRTHAFNNAICAETQPQGPLRELACASIALGGPTPASAGSAPSKAGGNEEPPAWLPVTLQGVRLRLGRPPAAAPKAARPKKKRRAGAGLRGLPSWVVSLAARLLPGMPLTISDFKLELQVPCRDLFALI